MQQKLWINRWNDKRKAIAVRKQEVGIGFLSNYQMTDFHKVLYNLQVGLETTKGSNTSSYVTFIPPSGNEVVKVRLSDHPSTIEEWEPNELTGLPNRRYSIVIFSNKSMPNESKQKLKELNWKCYKSQNIPVYEKTFNRYYLKETFPKLISILQTIYKGGAPEDKSLPVNITENNQQINENKTMNKKQTIRMNEAQLKRVIAEAVKRVMNESKIGSKLQDIIDQLMELTTSGYIPFSTPSPSSTEQIVKDNVIEAIHCLKKAKMADMKLYR